MTCINYTVITLSIHLLHGLTRPGSQSLNSFITRSYSAVVAGGRVRGLSRCWRARVQAWLTIPELPECAFPSGPDPSPGITAVCLGVSHAVLTIQCQLSLDSLRTNSYIFVGLIQESKSHLLWLTETASTFPSA